jgi:LCP family protein required for cell wall assembly
MARRSTPLPKTVQSRRRRATVRLVSATLGVVLGVGTLALIWPRPDPNLSSRQLTSPADLAKPPTRPVTVLVIGIDAERVGDSVNKAAPSGPANADALFLVRVNPGAQVQVVTLPTELAVNVPGQSKPQPLGRLYRLGGVALLSDAIRELVGLDAAEPDRYLVVSRSALRELVDDLGGIEVSPTQVMRYHDKTQDFRIDLQAGLQRLQGRQVEQLVRFRNPEPSSQGRQADQQEAMRGLLRGMLDPTQLGKLPSLVGSLKGQVATNLSDTEVLSLLAASLSKGDAIEFSSVPLAPPGPGHGTLRQMRPSAGDPLWPPAPAPVQP